MSLSWSQTSSPRTMFGGPRPRLAEPRRRCPSPPFVRSLVTLPGFEPGLHGREPCVLPLDDSAELVDPERIELSSPACKAGIFPLDEGPVSRDDRSLPHVSRHGFSGNPASLLQGSRLSILFHGGGDGDRTRRLCADNAVATASSLRPRRAAADRELCSSPTAFWSTWLDSNQHRSGFEPPVSAVAPHVDGPRGGIRTLKSSF